MPSKLSAVVLLASLVSSALSAPSQYDFSKIESNKIIKKDVLIVGGGSSGIHAAISLKDRKYSIMVVESKNRLGGHTETVEDGASGRKAEAGVLIFHNQPEVLRYFARFNIPLANQSVGGIANPLPFDYRTGQAIPVEAVKAGTPSPQAVGLAYQKLAGFLAQWPQMDQGLFLPDPVPDVLLQPMSGLIKQLGLEALVPSAYGLSQNIGDFLNTPVVEVVRVLSLSIIKQAVQQSFLTTAKGDNSELYLKATAELHDAKSLLLSSKVVYTKRQQNSVQVVVETPEGLKYICAKKVLMTVPPRPEALQAFDLRQNEKEVFNKLLATGYFTALLNNTGFPLGFSTTNVSPEKPFGLPELPTGYVFRATPIPGVLGVYYASGASRSAYAFSDDHVKAEIVSIIKKLQAANPKIFNQTEPNFVYSSNHSPYAIQARPEDIKAGIYKKMYALQGQGNFFWTGGAFRAQDSSALWDFNKNIVLPALMKTL
ncbi:Amine oxidase flavin-containing superfamily [Pyrenophora teres f. maculata]|nr:Amine oxidase flavin-containing superfamily [Pyrenophora teres f. maculata]